MKAAGITVIITLFAMTNLALADNSTGAARNAQDQGSTVQLRKHKERRTRNGRTSHGTAASSQGQNDQNSQNGQTQTQTQGH